MFDVAALMEDSETKTAALEKVAELEDELGHVSDLDFYIQIHSLLLYEVFTAKVNQDPHLYTYLKCTKLDSIHFCFKSLVY